MKSVDLTSHSYNVDSSHDGIQTDGPCCRHTECTTMKPRCLGVLLCCGGDAVWNQSDDEELKLMAPGLLGRP